MRFNSETIMSLLSIGEDSRILRKPCRVLVAAIWEIRHRPSFPPVLVKHRIIKGYAKQFKLRTFIETGTCYGDTTFEMRKICSNIYSIEVNEDLLNYARKRFARYSHIRIIGGNSSEQLPRILSTIDEPCLFWLDAHYIPNSHGLAGGDPEKSPILEELGAIFSHRIGEHVVLVDDAREFNGAYGYPLLCDLEVFVAEYGKGYSMSVAKDIIRIIPRVSIERRTKRELPLNHQRR